MYYHYKGGLQPQVLCRKAYVMEMKTCKVSSSEQSDRQTCVVVCFHHPVSFRTTLWEIMWLISIFMSDDNQLYHVMLENTYQSMSRKSCGMETKSCKLSSSEHSDRQTCLVVCFCHPVSFGTTLWEMWLILILMSDHNQLYTCWTTHSQSLRVYFHISDVTTRMMTTRVLKWTDLLDQHMRDQHAHGHGKPYREIQCHRFLITHMVITRVVKSLIWKYTLRVFFHISDVTMRVIKNLWHCISLYSFSIQAGWPRTCWSRVCLSN
jgi:hypothetical protein